MPRHLQKTMPRNLQRLTDSHNRISGVGEGSEERGGDWRIEKREREMAGALLHLNSTTVLASLQENQPRVHLPEKTANRRVLVLGGTGRVGGSTAIALSKLCPDLRIIVGGRNR